MYELGDLDVVNAQARHAGSASWYKEYSYAQSPKTNKRWKPRTLHLYSRVHGNRNLDGDVVYKIRDAVELSGELFTKLDVARCDYRVNKIG